MNISFYKKEVASLQSLYETFNRIQFASDQKEADTVKQKQNDSVLTDMLDSDQLAKGGLLIGVMLVLLVLGMVAFLTIWLLN